MRNEYAKPLYDLYKKAREWRDNFRETAISYLVESKDGLAPKNGLQINNTFTPVPYDSIVKKNIRTFADEELSKAYLFLREFREKWRNDVGDIIDKLPQISFRMRFDNPTDNKNAIRMEYIGYDFSHDMNMLLDLFDKFDNEVDELFEIIKDYEASIYQPSDFAPKQEPKEEVKDAVYYLRYDEIQGKLYLNDMEVYKSNLGSKLDKALSDAFKAPETTVKTAGSVASALDAIKMPKSLKRLAFRASKGSFVAKAEITADDLKNANLDKETLDLEIQKLSK